MDSDICNCGVFLHRNQVVAICYGNRIFAVDGKNEVNEGSAK